MGQGVLAGMEIAEAQRLSSWRTTTGSSGKPGGGRYWSTELSLQGEALEMVRRKQVEHVGLS
jgi:hypothetical protein